MAVAEPRIDARLVERLLHDQVPWLVGGRIVDRGRGWDNAVFEVAGEYAVRLPIRESAVPLLRNELRWMPVLAPLVSVPTPVPVHHGLPGAGYPWPWSVVRWLPGRVVSELAVEQRRYLAEPLAAALAGLHRPADPAAPVNPFRGVPLATRQDTDEKRLASLPSAGFGVLSVAHADGLAAPRFHDAPCWLHGDPHPLNLITDGVTLTGLIDFGDLTAGDPASDLATAWMTFDRPGRARFVREYERCRPSAHSDAGLWRRARGWAAVLAGAFHSAPSPGAGLLAAAHRVVRELSAEMRAVDPAE